MAAQLTAELGLNGEKFSAKLKQTLGALAPEVRKAGEEAGKAIEPALAPGLIAAERKIKETIRRAMAATGESAAVLDLDLPGLKSSAAAAEKKAAAARALAQALEVVHRSTDQVSAAMKIELQAAQGVADKFELQAAAAREEIIALERLQAELGDVTRAQNVAAGASNNARYAWQNAGNQVGDFWVQVAGGTGVIRAFSMQAPQLVGAIQMMGNEAQGSSGKFAAFARFMSGPWGIALGVALPIIGIVGEKLLNLGDDADKSKDKVDGLRKAIERLTSAGGQIDQAAYDVVSNERKLAEAALAKIEKETPSGRAAMIDRAVRRRQAQQALSDADLALDTFEKQRAARQKGDADGAREKAAKKAAEEVERANERADKKAETAAARAAKAAEKQNNLLAAWRAGLAGAADGDLPRLNDAQQALYRAAQLQLDTYQRIPGAQRLQLDWSQELKTTETDRLARVRSLHEGLAEISELANGQFKIALEIDQDKLRDLARDIEDVMGGGLDVLWQRFEKQGLAAASKIAAEAARDIFGGTKTNETLKRLSGNVSLGLAGASLVGGSKVGGALGGEIGAEAGKELAKGAFGKMLGKFGEVLGPIGGILGGIAGSLLGGLFGGSKPSASAVVTSVSAPAAIAGNSGELQQALSGISVNLQSSLQKIIEALGGTAGAFNVSIGQREDYYRVSGTGSTLVSAKYPDQPGVNLLYNGQDANEALRIAILDALGDGAVQGISASVKKLITSNQDIDLGLSKATRLQGAFKDLKQLTDPIGAAIDAVNLKFKQLVTIAKEAGATGDEMAQLEELYKRERSAAIEAAGAASETLKSFLQNLRAGSASPLGLGEQEANARAALDPYREAIAAGKAIDVDAFQRAAQTFLDVERQRYGSTQGYFDQFNAITALTEKAIAQIDAQAAGADKTNPFDQAIATSTQATANILEQQSAQNAEQIALLQSIAAATGVSTDNWWLTERRGY